MSSAVRWNRPKFFLRWPKSLQAAADAAFDRLASSDPGFMRLRLAMQALLVVILDITTATAYLVLTGAGDGHQVLLIIALFAGFNGLLGTIAVTDTFLPAQGISVTVISASSLVAVAIGINLAPYTWLALASFPVILTLGALGRRWGPRGGSIGVPMFVGDLVGLFLHANSGDDHLAALAVVASISIVIDFLVRASLFRPDSTADLARALHSLRSRARDISSEVATLLAAPRDGSVVQLEHKVIRALDRYDECFLIIDAHISPSPTLELAARMHERLFDAQLGLTNLARTAAALRTLCIPQLQHKGLYEALAAFSRGDMPASCAAARGVEVQLHASARLQRLVEHDQIGVLVGRMASSIILAATAIDGLVVLASVAAEMGTSLYLPSSALVGGWLPGASRISGAASLQRRSGGQGRFSLPAWARSAVQAVVAMSLATVLGYVFSAVHFYWAVIASYVTFVGTNNEAEEVRKGLLRILGAMAGTVVGSVVVDSTGGNVWVAASVVAFSLFLGVYFLRLNYLLIVAATTVAAIELFGQLGQLSEGLILVRLGETTIGAAASMLTVWLVLPLRSERVILLGVKQMLCASEPIVDAAIDQMTRSNPERGSSKNETSIVAVDSAYQALLAAAAPLRRFNEPGRSLQRIISACTGLRYHLANVAWHSRRVPTMPFEGQTQLLEGKRRFSEEFSTLEAAYGSTTTRNSLSQTALIWWEAEAAATELFGPLTQRHGEVASGGDDLILTLRGLQGVDGALAKLAELAHLQVVSTSYRKDYLEQLEP